MANEKFKVKFGLAVGDTSATIDATTGDIVTAGDVEVGGNTIKKSGGTPVIEFSGTNLTTLAGNLEVDGNNILSSAGATAITMSNQDVNVQGQLRVTGDVIRKSGGNTVLSFSGTNLVTTAGDLTVGGDTIRDSTNTAAIEMTGANVAVQGDLNVLGGEVTIASPGYIYSDTGLAIAISGNDVSVSGDLTVTGNDIKKSGGDTVLTFSGTNLVTTAGDLVVNGNSIRSNGNTVALELSAADVAVQGDLTVVGNDIYGATDLAMSISGPNVIVAGDLTVTGNDIKSSTATAISLSGTNATVAGDLAVNGGDLTTNQTTGNLFNTTATTVNVGGNANVNIGSAAGTVTIPGNLTVQGTTTTIDTANLNVEDNIITLNYGFTGTPPTSLRSGIEIERGTDPNVVWQWNELNKWWEPEGGTGVTERNIWAAGNVLAGDVLATNGNNIYLNNADATAANSALTVKKGGGASASIRWNAATNRWETSVDTGVTWIEIPNQDLDITSDVTFNSVRVTDSFAAGGATIGASGEIGTLATFDATGAASGATMQLGLRSENATAGYSTTNSIVDHGQNRPGGTAATSGNPNMIIESTRGTAAAPTATGSGDTLGSLNIAGHDGVRGLGTQVNGGSIQLIGIAGQAYLNNGTFTTQAGATTILRSQPNNLRLTSTSRQNLFLASYTGGTTNTPPTQNLLFNSTTMTTQYDAAGNAINGHGRQDISFYHPTLSIFGVPAESTANADNTTLPGSNQINFYTSRQSGWSTRRDIVEAADTLAQIRVFGQTTNNSTNNGSHAGTIEFKAAETFSTTRRGSQFKIQTGEIGTNTLSDRLVLDSNTGSITTTRIQQRAAGGNTTYGGEISMKAGIRNGASGYDRATELSVTAITTDGSSAATYETKTNRYDGTNYSPTQTGDQLGRFTFLGNYSTSTTPLSVNAAGTITVRAAENFTATASGTSVALTVNKLGTNDGLNALDLSSTQSTYRSDAVEFQDSALAPLVGNKISYNRVYGQWQHDATITAVAANTAYAVPFQGVNSVIDFANIATASNTSEIRPNALGMYKLQFSAQVQNSDNQDHTVTFWWRKNGVDITNSAGYFTVPKANVASGALIVGWDNIVQVTTITDYYQLMYAVSDVAVTMPFIAAAAPRPGAAAVFLTLVPIGA